MDKRNLATFFGIALQAAKGVFGLPIPGEHVMPVHIPTKAEAAIALRPTWKRRKRELARTKLRHANGRG